MRPLAARDRRALAALLLMLPLFGLAYAMPRLRTAWTSRWEAAQIALDRLARERGLRDSQAMLTASVRSATMRFDSLAGALPDAATTESAQSDLVRRIRSAAVEHNVAVVDVSAEATDTLTSGVRLLRAQLRGESDLAGTTGLLRALSRLRTPTRVSRILLERATPEPIGGVGNSDGRNVLRIALTVESLVLLGSTERAP
jgi:hypothetical protein